MKRTNGQADIVATSSCVSFGASDSRRLCSAQQFVFARRKYRSVTQSQSQHYWRCFVGWCVGAKEFPKLRRAVHFSLETLGT